MSFRVVKRDPVLDQTLPVSDDLSHDAAYDLVNALHDDASPSYPMMLPSRVTAPVMFRDLPDADIRPAVTL